MPDLENENAIPAGQPLPKEEPVVAPEPPVEPKLFAEKFKSPEELESSYLDLNSKLGEQGSELAELRASNKILQEQLKGMSAPQQPEATPAGVDYNAELKGITDKYDNGDLTTAQMQQAILELGQKQANESFQNQIGEVTNNLRGEFESKLAERDQNKVIQDFHSKNPDFQQLVDSGKLNEIKASNPLHDDLSAYYAFKAAEAENNALARVEEIRSGKEPASKTLTDAGHAASVTPPKPKLTGRALEQSMLEKARAAGA